jgi:hypothetical protein
MSQSEFEQEKTDDYIKTLQWRISALEKEKKERAKSLLDLSERLIQISGKTRNLSVKIEEAKNKAYSDGLWKSLEIISKSVFTNTESKDSAIEIMSSIRVEIERLSEKTE